MSLSAPKEVTIAPTARIGPFEVLREVSRAPGALLFEARDAGGQPRLLQLARCRAVTNDTERAERLLHEKAIAKQTFELLGDAELTVHAHGGLDAEGGERLLFWALPWSEGPLLGERLLAEPLALGELLGIGIALAERMITRHAWGRVDPLLSEDVLRLRPTGRPEVLGVPIAVHEAWLSEEMPPTRLAPEERGGGARVPAGDIWRLGRLLLALATHTRDVPDSVLACFLALAEDDDAKRPSSATAALDALERAALSPRPAVDRQTELERDILDHLTRDRAPPVLIPIAQAPLAAAPAAEPDRSEREATEIAAEPDRSEREATEIAAAPDRSEREATEIAAGPDRPEREATEIAALPGAMSTSAELESPAQSSSLKAAAVAQSSSLKAAATTPSSSDEAEAATPSSSDEAEAATPSSSDEARAVAAGPLALVTAEADPKGAGTSALVSTEAEDELETADLFSTPVVPEQADLLSTQVDPEPDAADMVSTQVEAEPGATGADDLPDPLQASSWDIPSDVSVPKSCATRGPEEAAAELLQVARERADTLPCPVVLFERASSGESETGADSLVSSRSVGMEQSAFEEDDDSLPMLPPELVEAVEMQSEAITHRSEPKTPVPQDAPAVLVDRMSPEEVEPAPVKHATGGASPQARDAFAPGNAATEPMPVPPAALIREAKERMARLALEHAAKSVISEEASPFSLEEPPFVGALGVPPAEGFDVVRPIDAMPVPAAGPRGPELHHAVPIEAMAASWQQPVLPTGESPWSEIVHPRGTHHRDRSAFPGFADEVPIPPPRGEKRAQPFDDEPLPGLPAEPSYEPAGSDEMEAELAETMRGLDKRKFVSAVLVALVIFGFFALISRVGGDPVEQKDPVVITSTNEISLDSDPPGATVVSERDGAVLGKTPIQVLVAPGVEAAVFLVAPEREPIRLVLPSRGGITGKLSALDTTECVVTLKAPDGIAIEGIDVDLGSAGERSIPGAAVVRAKPGQELRGARLVLCPGIGGQAEQELKLERVPQQVSVRVTQPEGAAAYLNGDPIGNVPGVGRTHAAFSRVRIDDQNGETDERWVSTEADAEVLLSAPRPRLQPHVVAPDGEHELEVPDAQRPAAVEKADTGTKLALQAKPDEVDDAKVDDAKVDDDDGKAPTAKPKLSRPQARARRLLKAGTKLLMEGRLDRARETLAECVDIDEGAAECHRNLGMAYWRARSTHKAREHFTRYLELAPRAADADYIRKKIAQ